MNDFEENELQETEEMFKVLGNSTRLKILLKLREEEKCVHEIAESINEEISNISHHLRRLRDKKLVNYRKEGRHKYYQIKDHHVLKMLEGGINHSKK